VGSDIAFAVGQIWTLTGADFADAKVVIDRMEIWHDKPIVHISVTGLPKHYGGFQGTIFHLPFSEVALRASVAALEISKGTAFSGFEGGYDQWKAPNGGVFTITVQQAVTGILSQLPPPMPNTSPST
jgi:hypothetical protein